jgi:hypothetical protein
VNNFKINGINVWNVTRMALFNISNQDHFKHYSKKLINFISWNYLKNLIYPYSKISKILVLTPNIRVKFQDVYGNKFLNWLPENGYKTTFLEYPTKNKTIYGNDNEIIIPMERIILKILIMEKKILKNIKNELYKKLKEFEYNEFMLKNIDYLSSYISRYISSIYFFRNYFKQLKPKVLFSISHYSTINKGAIKAANEIGIPTIDVQHGLINKKSPGYIDTSGIKEDIPKYLFVYGKYFKDIISDNSNLFENENIIISGNYYLSKYITSNKKRTFNKEEILLITTQPAVDENTYINIIKEALKIKLKVILKIHPSESKEKYKTILNKFDITLKEKENIYELFNIAKYHATVFSTSAVESLVFGVPNIIIPWKGYETQLDFLIDNKTTVYYNKPLEKVIKILKNNATITYEKGSYFFEYWNQKKIDDFLKNLGIK